jgi:hypothetical protein
MKVISCHVADLKEGDIIVSSPFSAMMVRSVKVITCAQYGHVAVIDTDEGEFRSKANAHWKVFRENF